MGKFKQFLEQILFRNGERNNSPSWAFLEGFRVPDIDKPELEYLFRIRIVATPWFGIFLHKLSLPDSRQILHNHPFPFVSIILKGGYIEFIPGPYYAKSNHVKRINIKRFGSKKNPLSSYHWIAELDRTPTWTLVLVGRRKRIWGYLDRNGVYTDFDKSDFNALDSRGSLTE